MSKFIVTGLDDLSKKLIQIGEELNGHLAKDMLDAGKIPIESAWKKGIEESIMQNGTIKKYFHVVHGHVVSFYQKSRTTGIMVRSIEGKTTTNKWNGYSDIYPQKTRTRGRGKITRNAEIAFILNYGKDGQNPKDYISTHIHIDEVEKECVKKMEEVFDDFLKKKGL